MIKYFGIEKNEITKHCLEKDNLLHWNQMKLVDIESRLVPTNMKEAIHSFSKCNHTSKIFHPIFEIQRKCKS